MSYLLKQSLWFSMRSTQPCTGFFYSSRPTHFTLDWWQHTRNKYTILFENVHGKDHLEELGVDGEIYWNWGHKGVYQIHLTQDTDYQWVLMGMIHFRFHNRSANLTSWATSSLLSRTLLHGLSTSSLSRTFGSNRNISSLSLQMLTPKSHSEHRTI